MKQNGKNWTDVTGREVPKWSINPVLQVEEKHAQRIAALALRAEKALVELNKAVDVAQQEVFEAKLKDAKIKEFKRDITAESITFGAFDKSVKVDIKTTRKLVFDKSYVSMIKEKFEEFFSVFDKDEVQSKKFSFLREIVNSLLYKSNGGVDQTSVNEIRSHKATAERIKFEGYELFVEAVDLFDKAIRSEPGNRLYYVEVDEGDGMRRVALKYSDI
jgi:hypothetical protein